MFPGATEEFCGAGTPFKSVCVDANNACLVLDEATGQQRLVTKPGLFSPSAEETVVEVRPLIKLADHEAVIVRDAKGKVNLVVLTMSHEEEFVGANEAVVKET